MTSVEDSQLTQILHDRCVDIADSWYKAILRTSYVSLSAQEVRDRLHGLTQRLIGILLSEPLDQDQAQMVGRELARLHYLQPEVLGKTQEVLTHQLLKGLPAPEVVELQPRVARLLAGLAAGFLRQAQDTMLSEQETISRAARSELQRVQEKLRQERNFISAILDTAGALILVTDTEGRIVRFNQACTNVTGYSFEEVRGRHVWEILTAPDRIAAARAFFDNVAAGEIDRTAFPNHAEGYWVSKDGDRRQIAWWYTALPNNGRTIQHIIATGVDITERVQTEEALRKSEARFRAVFETAPIGIAITDSQGRLHQVNQAFQEMLGYSEDELRNTGFAEFTHPDDVGRNLQLFTELVLAKRDQFRMQKRYYHKDGHIVWGNMAVAAVRDPNGELRHTFAMIEDITERKRAEEHLILADKMASMSAMAASLAHELRNPLSNISVYAQLLLNHPHDAGLCIQWAETVHHHTKRASDIIERLLNFAESGSDAMAEVDLHAVLDDALLDLSYMLDSQGVTVRKELESDLPRINGNAGLLRQVFTNLIWNACNAMPDEGGTLTVTSRITEAQEIDFNGPTTGVEIQFIDTGHGIPREHMHMIFDPFFSTMPQGRGTGLGLAVSYRIIQRHQGTIDVESEVDKGTTFTIRLPALPGNGPANETTEV